MLGRELAPAAAGEGATFRTGLVLTPGRDRPGILLEMLRPFAERGVNLSSLMSRPLRSGLGLYCFILVVDAHSSSPELGAALSELLDHGVRIKNLGSYLAWPTEARTPGAHVEYPRIGRGERRSRPATARAAAADRSGAVTASPAFDAPTFDRVVIVGLGLIGGSLAHVLSPDQRVVAIDVDGATRDAARADGIEVVDDVRDAAGPGALVVVAVPVPWVGAVFAKLEACSGTLVTDVASVKRPVLEAARASRLRFVGGHPMAGRELAGYAAASDSLFSGARWALCLDGATSVRDMLAVAEVVLRTGASVVPTTAADHDRAVALVSHLPHVLAAALAGSAGSDSTRELGFGLAAGSFRDGTRVARSPAAFWAGIADENGENLAAIVRSIGAEFAALADWLDRHDREAVESFFARGVRGRVEFERRTALPTTFTIADAELERDPEALSERLLSLGRRGGYITHIERRSDELMLRARVPDTEPA